MVSWKGTVRQDHVTSPRLTSLSLVPSRVVFEPLALGLVDSLKALASFVWLQEAIVDVPWQLGRTWLLGSRPLKTTKRETSSKHSYSKKIACFPAPQLSCHSKTSVHQCLFYSIFSFHKLFKGVLGKSLSFFQA